MSAREIYIAAMAIVSGMLAWVSDKLGLLAPVLGVLMVSMVGDYVTGMMASKVEAIEHPGDSNYGWNSKKGLKGIFKKFGYLFMIAAAICLDWIINYAAANLGIEIPVKTFFALLIAIWYVLNELLSICENCGRMGTNVPQWMLKYIAVLRDKIDDTGNGENQSV